MTRPCPTCKRPADLSKENRARPFCSERCQLLDLGRWFDGDYVVPGEPAVDTLKEKPDE